MDNLPTYEEQVAFFKNHLKTNGGIELFIKHLLSEGCGFQTVHTPFKLCREILGKLDEHTKLEGKSIAILFNLEFLHVLIRKYHIPPKNITIFVDDEREFEFARLEYGMIPDVNLFYIDMEKTIKTKRLHTPKGEAMKKFDVVVGNPPYQAPKNMDGPKKGTLGGDLWSKFVDLSIINLTKDNGHISLVHPTAWRKPEHKLYDKLRQNNLIYLETHNKKDGIKTFGKATRYDWYVLQKSPYQGTTHIVDDEKNAHNIDIREWAFLPSGEFDLLNSILAEKGEPACEVLYSRSLYGTDKRWMSDKKTKEFQYPCVHGLTAAEGTKFWYSSKKEGFFGVPKVILTWGRHQYPIIDMKGEYGMTQIVFGLQVDNVQEAKNIVKAINSEKFKRLLAATKWSAFQTEFRMFKYFRKDFWKEFV